jgi:hypothetical protein
VGVPPFAGRDAVAMTLCDMTFKRVIVALLSLFFVYYGWVLWGISRGKAYFESPLTPPLIHYRMLAETPRDPSPCALRQGGLLTFAADSEWMLRDTTTICSDTVPVQVVGIDRGKYRLENGQYIIEGPAFAGRRKYGTATVAGDTLRMGGMHFGIRTRTFVRQR